MKFDTPASHNAIDQLKVVGQPLGAVAQIELQTA
ncbi:hypothetical protein AVHY2522_21935 [Acidovorax sp. SUPP2522]|nr:hypothetical protein AVHY2522_21935 [Acidovorax sp. SUPP2522]